MPPEDLQAVAVLACVDVDHNNVEKVPIRVLVPAFTLSERRVAFVAGFIIFLLFLLIDLIVAAILMAMGMMMPPVSVSLPLKVLVFVLIDGWTLLFRAVAGVYSCARSRICKRAGLCMDGGDQRPVVHGQT